MKNKKLLTLVGSICLILVLAALPFMAACAQPAPPPEEAWEWPEKLDLVSMGAGTGLYATDVAYTIALSEATGVKVRIVTEDSLVLRYKWIKQGLYFWSSWEAGHAKDMMEGKSFWASRDGGPFQQRIAYSSGPPSFSSYFVRGDSDIRTPYDIKPGMKIVFLTLAPAGRTIMEGLLAWAEIDPEDVEWVPANTLDTNVAFIMEGKGDVAWLKTLSPILYEAEAAPHGLAWIELNAEEDPEGAKRLQELFFTSGFEPMTRGVPSSIGVWGMTDLSCFATRAETDPELVYHIVKWLDENHDSYKDAHPRCTDMTIETLMKLAETSFIPVHDGTVRYLKEKGVWTAAHEARQQANINLITRYVEAYQTAMDMADEKGIEVDPRNESWIELWENYKKELDLPGFKMFPGLD